jgi:hypothetical protein
VANGEIYVQLSVDFADDPKLRKLARYGKDGRLARDLYVQMLCYCKRTLSDGFVPFEQVAFMVLPEPERAGMKQLRLLIDVEVCTTTEGGALVAAFLKRNKSRAEVMRTAERKKAASTKANHERWHSERPSASCPLCHPTTDPPTDPLLSVVGSDHGDSTESTEDIGHRTEDIGHRSEVIPADKPRRASRAPASYTPTEQQIEWALEKGLLAPDALRETERWLDHHRAKGSKFLDWDAAWRTWMSRAVDYAATPGRGGPGPVNGGPPPGTSPHDEWMYR